jgi:hypothetical protein
MRRHAPAVWLALTGAQAYIGADATHPARLDSRRAADGTEI